jgi:hypothetical protein
MKRDLLTAFDGDDSNSVTDTYESIASKPIDRKDDLKPGVKPSYSIALTGNREILDARDTQATRY